MLTNFLAATLLEKPTFLEAISLLRLTLSLLLRNFQKVFFEPTFVSQSPGIHKPIISI